MNHLETPNSSLTFIEWLRAHPNRQLQRIVWRDGFRWVLVGKKGQPWVYWPPITG